MSFAVVPEHGPSHATACYDPIPRLEQSLSGETWWGAPQVEMTSFLGICPRKCFADLAIYALNGRFL
jgi:hypothetical protein